MVMYTTAVVAARTRFEYWHDVICQHFVPADSRLEGRTSFNARFQTNALGPVDISRLAAPRHSWSRDESHVRKSPHEEFLLSLKLGGESCLGQGGREVRQRSGEMALYDTGRPFSYLLDSDIILVKIPRHEILARVPEADRCIATGFGRSSPVGALAASLIRQALSVDLSESPSAATRLGNSVLDAAAAALEWELSGHAGRVPKPHRLLNHVKSCMLANLPDRALDVESLAAKHNMSARTLNRLFALDGTTPMRWIWEQRLEAAYREINAGSTRVTDVALACGFSDLSHFSRVFKARFGVLPSSFARRR